MKLHILHNEKRRYRITYENMQSDFFTSSTQSESSPLPCVSRLLYIKCYGKRDTCCFRYPSFRIKYRISRKATQPEQAVQI